MLANQLPMIQITRGIPEVIGQYDNLAQGEQCNLRVFSETDIVAFSDSKNILSYTITEEFMNRNLDSRLCTGILNI